MLGSNGLRLACFAVSVAALDALAHVLAVWIWDLSGGHLCELAARVVASKSVVWFDRVSLGRFLAIVTGRIHSGLTLILRDDAHARGRP